MNRLIFGKFAPLHYGHLYLIRTALSQCLKDDVLYILVSHNPELDIAPSEVRADWIRQLIPDSRLKVIPTGEFPPSGKSVMAQRANFAYMCQYLPSDISIDKVYCNEWYGAHIARDFNAEWVQIDPQRNHYPVSARQIRSEPDKYSDFLPPQIKKWYMAYFEGRQA